MSWQCLNKFECFHVSLSGVVDTKGQRTDVGAVYFHMWQKSSLINYSWEYSQFWLNYIIASILVNIVTCIIKRYNRPFQTLLKVNTSKNWNLKWMFFIYNNTNTLSERGSIGPLVIAMIFHYSNKIIMHNEVGKHFSGSRVEFPLKSVLLLF